MRDVLESEIIAALIKNPNFLSMYKDKLTTKLFTGTTLEIFEYITNLAIGNHDINRYAMTNKFGSITDQIINSATHSLDFSAFEISLNQLIALSTSEAIAGLCSNYLAEYHSGEVIDNAKFVMDLSNNLITSEDVPVLTNNDALSYLIEQLNNNEPLGEISLGHGLDETLQGGGNRGEVMFLAGKAKMFKTSLAINLFNHMTIKNKGIFFSLEMSAKELWKKQYGIVEGETFEHHKKTCKAFDKYGDFIQLTKNNAFIIDYPNLSIFTIHKLVKMHRLKHGNLDFIIIDHLNIIQKSKGKMEYEAITEITRQLKIIAKEEDIFIICLSQLNRNGADRKEKRPQLSDLRGSGSIEQDADFVVTVHREEWYYSEIGKATPEAIKNVLEVNFAAARRGQQNLYHYRVNLPLGKIMHSLSDWDLIAYNNALKEPVKTKIKEF